MYFPHLFARREELLAFRNFCGSLDHSETVIPIFEAISQNSAPLRKCLEEMNKVGHSAIVITNPNVGDFKKIDPVAWEASLAPVLKKMPSAIPAFRCTPNTSFSNVTKFLQKYKDRPVAIVYWNPSFSNAEIKILAGMTNIKFHINAHEKLAKEQRALLPKKKVVDVKDEFNVKVRNADYEGTEFFTDRHLTFAENAIGFGDFSMTGSKYVSGGGPAHAVAIHLMHTPKGKKGVWVEHFVSDDTDKDVGDVNSKYLQAAKKAVSAATTRPKEFGSTSAIGGYLADVAASHSSGLGMNKRRQVSHHIELMHALLSAS